MRLLGAEVLRRRRRQPDAEGRDQRGDARLGHQRRRHLLPARLGARPASVSADGARVPVGDRPRGARADPRARRRGCPTRSSPASAAAATRWASSTRSSTIADVRLIGVEAGGEAIAPRPPRGALRRRQRRRAAGHAHLRAAGRRRQHRADAFDLGRPRLRGGRPRARLAARDRAAPSTPTSTTRRRSTAFQRAGAARRHPAGARVGARDRLRAAASRSELGPTAIVLVNLSGRGDKDVQTRGADCCEGGRRDVATRSETLRAAARRRARPASSPT